MLAAATSVVVAYGPSAAVAATVALGLTRLALGDRDFIVKVRFHGLSVTVEVRKSDDKTRKKDR